MNSDEANQRFGFYRQRIGNSPEDNNPELFDALLPIHEELRRVLIYLGLMRPDNQAAGAEVARIELAGTFYPVPGLWLNQGLGEPPGTPLYLDTVAAVLTPNYLPVAGTVVLVGIVDKNNHVVCTGIRRLPLF